MTGMVFIGLMSTKTSARKGCSPAFRHTVLDLDLFGRSRLPRNFPLLLRNAGDEDLAGSAVDKIEAERWCSIAVLRGSFGTVRRTARIVTTVGK